MARRSSSVSRILPASPASTRLQYSESKYSGCLRNAAERLVPVSTSLRMSVSRRVTLGLVLPRATMSNDWIKGTPARIITASCRVKMAMSFCLIDLPPLRRRFLTLVIRMPCRRKLALTMASPPARISPRTSLPFLSLPSHSKTSSLMLCFAATAVAIVPPRMLAPARNCRVIRCRSLVRDRYHFLKCCDAGTDLDQARLAQVAHAFALRLDGDVHRGSFRQDDALDLLGDRHHLVDADPAL